MAQDQNARLWAIFREHPALLLSAFYIAASVIGMFYAWAYLRSFGINVFKVREVLQCPKLSIVPQSHPVVRGIANIRGQTISIMDLSLAIGGRAIEDIENAFVIISEYNRTVQGFLVREVDRIVNLNWKDILPPPSGAAGSQIDEVLAFMGALGGADA